MNRGIYGNEIIEDFRHFRSKKKPASHTNTIYDECRVQKLSRPLYTISTFPLDVAEGILRRLPVYPVLRCRCVSKAWLNLIYTPQFAKLHFIFSLKPHCLILRKVDYYGYGNSCFYSLLFDSLNSRVVTPKELTNPLISSQFNTNILGSCNGLLLISNTLDEIALWNRSTGKYNYHL